MGNCCRSIKSISQTPTITAGLYSGGDALGGLLTFAQMTNAQGTGIVTSFIVIDEGAQSAALDLVLFDQTFTATADNSAFTVSDADAVNIIGVVPVVAGDYVDMMASDTATVKNIGLAFKARNTGTIFGQLVTRGTPTYAATDDITVKLVVEQSV